MAAAIPHISPHNTQGFPHSHANPSPTPKELTTDPFFLVRVYVCASNSCVLALITGTRLKNHDTPPEPQPR